MQVESLQTVIDKLWTDVEGGKSAEIINWLTHLINSKIKELLEIVISDSLSFDFERSISVPLLHMPMSTSITNDLELYYNLPFSPVITSSYIQFYFSGIVADKDFPNLNPPIKGPVELSRIENGNYAIQLLISDYTINSGLYSIYEKHDLNFVINQKNLPVSIELTTTVLDELFPGIVKKYGEHLPCQFICNVTQSPSITSRGYQGGLILFEIDIDCYLDVIDRGIAVELGTVVDVNSTFSLNNWILNGSIEDIQIMSANVLQNNLDDDINIVGIVDGLNYLLNISVKTITRKIFGQGIQLPGAKGFKVADSKAVISNGYWAILFTPSRID